MNFPTYIAKRYLFAKKSHNAINIISAVSVACIMITTAAFITVLSVNNGFKEVFNTLFNVFDPDLKIIPAEGKTFIPDSSQLQKLLQIKGIAAYSKTVEENVLLKYEDKQYIATLKGVDDSYTQVNRLDTMITEGEFLLKDNHFSYAILGQKIATDYLQVNLNGTHFIQVNVLRKNATFSTNTLNAINQNYIYPKGFFIVEPEANAKYIIVPLSFAFGLLEDSLSVSALEIKIKPGYNVDEVKLQISNLMGKNFRVINRYQQKEQFYKILNYEKWIIFFILSFIFIIASFNVIGSIAVLIIEKKKDIGILYSMGADSKTISRVFQYEGIMISFFGCIAGLILGLIICLLQEKFGIIKLGEPGRFIIDSYPVSLQLINILEVLITVLTIGFIASWYTVKFIIGKYLSDNQTINT